MAPLIDHPNDLKMKNKILEILLKDEYRDSVCDELVDELFNLFKKGEQK